MASDATFQTERLQMRVLDFADIPDCLRLDTDPSVMRYIGGPDDVRTRASWLKHCIATGWPPRGGIWTVRMREDARFLGWCGLFPIPLQSARFGTEIYEIGYRYMPYAWGRGYATEAARAVLDHGFRALGHDQIVGVTDPRNHGSQHVLQKIGLRREGQRVAYGESVPFFRLTRRIYLQQAAESSSPA